MRPAPPGGCRGRGFEPETARAFEGVPWVVRRDAAGWLGETPRPSPRGRRAPTPVRATRYGAGAALNRDATCHHERVFHARRVERPPRRAVSTGCGLTSTNTPVPGRREARISSLKRTVSRRFVAQYAPSNSPCPIQSTVTVDHTVIRPERGSIPGGSAAIPAPNPLPCTECDA